MNQPRNPVARLKYETARAIRERIAGKAIQMLSPIGPDAQGSAGTVDFFGNIFPCCRYDIDTYDSAFYCD